MTQHPLAKRESRGFSRFWELLYGTYARAADTTMSKMLSSIAGRQAKATEKLEDEVK